MYINQARTWVILRGLGSAGLLFAARAAAVIYQLQFANRVFGPNFGGLIALLNQITFYILMAELGLAAATTSLLFEPVHRQDLTRVKALISALQKDVLQIACYLGPLSLLLTAVLSLWLHKQIPIAPLAVSLVLTCASALMTFMALPFQSHLSASDRVPLRNVLLGCGFALKITSGILLSKMMHSFVGLPMGITLVGVGELLLQKHLVMSSLKKVYITPEMIVDARRTIRKKAKYVLAHKIGYLFTYQSDYIILLLSSSLSLLGYYARYQYIYAGLLSFSIAVGGTVSAKMAERQIGLGQEAFPSFYRRTMLLVSCAAVFCGTLFFCFAEAAVRVLYRVGRYDHKAVSLFAILLMLNILKINDDLWIDTTGVFHKGYLLPIAEAATFVGLGLLLVTHFQIYGILYAGIVTNLVFSVIGKSFVIGGGVMQGKVPYTALIKILNLVGIGIAFYLLVTVVHLLPFGRVV